MNLNYRNYFTKWLKQEWKLNFQSFAIFLPYYEIITFFNGIINYDFEGYKWRFCHGILRFFNFFFILLRELREIKIQLFFNAANQQLLSSPMSLSISIDFHLNSIKLSSLSMLEKRRRRWDEYLLIIHSVRDLMQCRLIFQMPNNSITLQHF